MLLHLRFVLCSLDLDVQRAQRIIGFYLNYPQISEVGKSDHMVLTFVACLSIRTAYHARGACAHMSPRFEQTKMAAPAIINRARTGT